MILLLPSAREYNIAQWCRVLVQGLLETSGRIQRWQYTLARVGRRLEQQHIFKGEQERCAEVFQHPTLLSKDTHGCLLGHVLVLPLLYYEEAFNSDQAARRLHVCAAWQSYKVLSGCQWEYG
ncbi:hypothetical protein DUNSADRAFT_13785 [Dunaliella salina]|uniref:Uncharacterized protein n=1 Tax=Dunaliella salina TaxID=3046 RepID=A0ABQ7G8R0_DUNSA|nr:hypothetical protein DUNSADRAFT_13785 [Dunaliella salina]|eukprot:KAF5830975.1 hypothetical protein DUNSADRAFT_13785 [Dunaliella salina]